MDSVRISPVDRIPAVVSLAATNPDGSAATITDVDVAALPRGDLPAADTTWTSVTGALTNNVFAGDLTLAGPSATAQPGDVVITGGSHVWAKDTGVNHTQAVIVAFVYID